MDFPPLGPRGPLRNYLAPQYKMHYHFIVCVRERRPPAGTAGDRWGLWGMLYQAYQAHSDIMVPVRAWAGTALQAIGQPLAGALDNTVLRNLTAAYELIARAGLSHARPAFGIDSVTVGNREVAVHEHAALTTPFGTLLHFKKDIDTPQPR